MQRSTVLSRPWRGLEAAEPRIERGVTADLDSALRAVLAGAARPDEELPIGRTKL